MIDKVGVVALLIAVALSGCTSEDAPALTQADCEALGMTLSDDSGMDAIEHEHGEATEEHHEPACVEPEPSAPRGSVTLGTLPSDVSKFTTITINWTLGTTNENGEDHAMDTRIMVGTEPLMNTTVQPTQYGTQVAQSTHQNFNNGALYTTEYPLEEEGTFYFYAFALIGSVNLWSEPAMITVGPVADTGIVHEIVVSGLGPQATIDQSSLTIQVGDKVKFINNDILPRTFAGGEFSEAVEGNGGESMELWFVSPGSVSYTSTTALDPVGNLSGTINVQS